MTIHDYKRWWCGEFDRKFKSADIMCQVDSFLNRWLKDNKGIDMDK
jgi:hypothetical protein